MSPLQVARSNGNFQANSSFQANSNVQGYTGGGSMVVQIGNRAFSYPTPNSLASAATPPLAALPPTTVFSPAGGTVADISANFLPALLNMAPSNTATAQSSTGTPGGPGNALALSTFPGAGSLNAIALSTAAAAPNGLNPTANTTGVHTQVGAPLASDAQAIEPKPAAFTEQGPPVTPAMDSWQQVSGTTATSTQKEDPAATVVAGGNLFLVINPSAEASTDGEPRDNALPTLLPVGPASAEDGTGTSSVEARTDEAPVAAMPVLGTVASAVDEQVLVTITEKVDHDLALCVTDSSSGRDIAGSSTDAVGTPRRVSVSLTSLAPIGLMAGYLFVSSRVPVKEKRKRLELPKPEPT